VRVLTEKEAQPLGRASAALMRSGAMHTCEQACARSEDNGVVLGAVMKQAFFEVPELLGARSADRCGRSQSEAIGSKKSCCLNFTSPLQKSCALAHQPAAGGMPRLLGVIAPQAVPAFGLGGVLYSGYRASLDVRRNSEVLMY
jgi:hypothetical protein